MGRGRIEASALHERIAVDYNKCIIDRSSGLAHHFTTPRSGALYEDDDEGDACSGSRRCSNVLGDHARGPGQRGGKGSTERSSVPRAWSGGERESRAADFRQVRDGEDYTAAQSQSAAMAKTKVSLRAAVQNALRANPGFRAVSVTPSLKDGHAVAEVALAKGEEVKTVSVPL